MIFHSYVNVYQRVSWFFKMDDEHQIHWMSIPRVQQKESVWCSTLRWTLSKHIPIIDTHRLLAYIIYIYHLSYLCDILYIYIYIMYIYIYIYIYNMYVYMHMYIQHIYIYIVLYSGIHPMHSQLPALFGGFRSTTSVSARWQAESRNLRRGGDCHGTLWKQKRCWQHLAAGSSTTTVVPQKTYRI